MPSRRLFPPRRRSAQLSLPPPNNSSPSGASTSTARPTIATAPQPVYPNYLNDTTGRGWDATLLVSSMIRDIPVLPPALSGPLAQVFHGVLEVIEAVKTLRDGRDECTQLMVRVTRFLGSFVEELKGKNVDDTRIASSLHLLSRNLMIIHADATRWSHLNIVERYLQRDKVMNAIARHEENLTNCFHTFQIGTLMTESSPQDRIERIGFPGPPLSARPLAASENTLGSIFAAGLHDFFERPASHAVFEQIAVAIQGRLEVMGSRGPSTSVGSSQMDATLQRSDDQDEFDQELDRLYPVGHELDWENQRVPKLYENEILALQNLGSVLVVTLVVNSPDLAELQGNLEHLRVEGDKWVQFDLVDTVVHANMMFETTDSVKRCLQEYDGLPRQEIYPEIIPPSDLPYLPSMLRNIENDVALRTKAIHLRDQHAILFIDLLMQVLDKYLDGIGRGDLLKLLLRVVEASNQLPSQLLITGVTDMTYQDKGGEATIFKCKYGARDVAARVIRVESTGEDEETTRSLQKIQREIITHRQLRNRNILELLGIFKSNQHPLTIITPWMENDSPENFIVVVRGLCAAIRFLHCCKPPIAHGDIKPSNVLIDEHGEAVLSDFGLTRIRHELTRTGTQSSGLGTLRYLAPEVFLGQVLRVNVTTDIYSLALTIWALASSELPFAHLPNEFLIPTRVERGERPPLPTMIGTFHSQSEAGKLIWGLLEQMWHQDPNNRPPMTLVKEKIDSIER
ncbi:hypothetical protein BS47DRAFT_1354984 [Hydnum rufescens UP504]|uniref:Protein kinase domain-containing protein n=1 Tax=Hydnum rufescens UP504 TaxID=1448309 RepID=A0A9P6DNH2_9AGAM|nr:hypothetical protein BS47DRAFT_1354984 [Hydnum rufescens UP504]